MRTKPHASTPSLESRAPVAIAALRRYSLSSLFLVTTLIAVWLGIFVAQPVLGIVAFVFSAPALMRVFHVVFRAKRRNESLSLAGKLGVFARSVVATIAVVLSALMALAIGCFGGLSIASIFFAQGLCHVRRALRGRADGSCRRDPIVVRWVVNRFWKTKGE
jgi:hypothetical protein